jgi:hypothetical protein
LPRDPNSNNWFKTYTLCLFKIWKRRQQIERYQKLNKSFIPFSVMLYWVRYRT